MTRNSPSSLGRLGMRRRELIALVIRAIVGLTALAPLVSSELMAAETTRTRHVALLAPADLTCEEAEHQLGTELTALGWSRGRGLVFDCLVGRTDEELSEAAATLI